MKQAPGILLVSANRFREPYPVYPLGVAYLQAAIARMLPHFEVRTCDLNLSPEEELVNILNAFQPKYVGISLRNIDDVNSFARNSFISGYKDIVQVVRKTVETVIIVGGAGFSIYPKPVFEILNPDFGICGEGEESLCRLIDCLEQDMPPASVEGLVWKSGGETAVNPRRGYAHTLDVKFDGGLVDFYWRESGMLNIQTKRGCPYRCIYCTYPLIEGRCVRTLEAERIAETLLFLYRRKRVDYVFFTDSVFNIAHGFNAHLCEAIIRSGARIRWGAYFTPHGLTPDMLDLYRRAGLTHIEFGTESLCDAQLENYGKHFTFADVRAASEMCVKKGVYCAHFLILGGYGETGRTVAETFHNSRYLRNTVLFPFWGMRIYPGTGLHEIAIAEGRVSKDDTLVEPVYYLSGHTDLPMLKRRAAETGKAWIFPDETENDLVTVLRKQKNKKGPIWEYLRKS
jgi:radical SAM superfamily enzyme YgiQ (UPF0313 family)